MVSAIARSVRFKVMAVILATTLAALAVSAVALITYEARTYRATALTDAQTQADIIGRTVAVALAFDDPESGKATLALLESRRGIDSAAIYDARGRLFATYVRGNGELQFPALTARPGARVSGDSLQLFHPVVENGELLGTVYLQASFDLVARLQDSMLILGTVMLISLAAAAVVSLRLQRSVTAPVLAVTAVARKVIEERDFTLRARKTTDDEIGLLVDSFNAMLAEIGQRTEAVETTNRQLREETEERRAAEAALREADRRKDEFLAMLAHELRNPLAPMVNALSLLKLDPAGNEAVRQRAEDIIRRQLSHMVRLVDDLLDVSRITTDKLTVHQEPVELGPIVHSAIDTVQPVIEAQEHELTVELPPSPVHLRADAVRLSQVLSNLLNNAARYTPQGGRIALRAGIDGDRIRIEVADDGVGISAEMLPTIFQMFTQGDGSVSAERQQSGLGVGLALSKRLIELHGGTIEAHSTGLGCGSTFVIDLPLLEAPVSAGFKGRALEAGSLTRPNRILLVDDNVDFASSLAMLLRELGHEVYVAHDAAQAIDLAREVRLDVAFLDLGLPDVSGYDLARRLHEMPESSHVVLIALSGWGQAPDVQRSREAGFARHLVKPVEIGTIKKTLEAVAPVAQT
jgi:two-component system, sensor histidine kinase